MLTPLRLDKLHRRISILADNQHPSGLQGPDSETAHQYRILLCDRSSHHSLDLWLGDPGKVHSYKSSVRLGGQRLPRGLLCVDPLAIFATSTPELAVLHVVDNDGQHFRALALLGNLKRAGKLCAGCVVRHQLKGVERWQSTSGHQHSASRTCCRPNMARRPHACATRGQSK